MVHFASMIGSDNKQVLVSRLIALAVFVAALWAIQGVNWATDYGLNDRFGLIPRHLAGLDGIAGMPVLHGSFAHLMSNTPPLVLMGVLLAVTATRALLAVNLIIVLLGGALVWLFAGTAIHIGASGLVFGWFGFLIARGFVDRSPVTLGAAVIVGLLYGSIVWGVLPGQPGVSWEAHLFGALAGVAAAFLVRTHVHSPRVRNVEQQ
ncbi:MAG: rhomboid family intramembrane serine protease [Pseudomonadota bacterium]